jgi:DNA-binding HxlR family transcriptional regulator
MTCSIARTVSIVGDAWTLLLLREVFLRSRRFEDFQAHTGMSPHLLSVRLSKLVSHGILDRVVYQKRPLRYEYRPTAKGLELYPIVLALTYWGDRWTSGRKGPPTRLVHKTCGRPMYAVPTCSECGERIRPQEVRAEIGDALATERASMRARLKGPVS